MARETPKNVLDRCPLCLGKGYVKGMGEMECEPCRGTGRRSVLMENLMLDQLQRPDHLGRPYADCHTWEDFGTYERCWSCGFIKIKPGIL